MEGKKRGSINEFAKPLRNISDLPYDGGSDLTPTVQAFRP